MKLRTTMLAIVLAALAPLTITAMSTAADGFHTGQARPVMPFKVHGTISLADDTTTHTVTVRLRLSGFAPNTKHVMHIHKGLMCDMMGSSQMPAPTMGKILVPLGIHKSDAHGHMDETFSVKTRVKVAFGAIHVMIHHGPTISTASGARPVTCADIH